jgi:hypothetical protein
MNVDVDAVNPQHSVVSTRRQIAHIRWDGVPISREEPRTCPHPPPPIRRKPLNNLGKADVADGP